MNLFGFSDWNFFIISSSIFSELNSKDTSDSFACNFVVFFKSINACCSITNFSISWKFISNIFPLSRTPLSFKIIILSFLGEEITTASPSLKQIKFLINTWLNNKSDFLSGKSEINLSKIVQNDLINRLTKERQLDIQKGIYRNINTNIENIVLLTQTASRIAALLGTVVPIPTVRSFVNVITT